MRVLLKKDFKLSTDNKASNSLNHEKKISAFLPILIPIILISISTLLKYPSFNIVENELTNFISFIGKPEIALLIGLIISMRFMKRDNSKNISKWIGNSLKNSLDVVKAVTNLRRMQKDISSYINVEVHQNVLKQILDEYSEEDH